MAKGLRILYLEDDDFDAELVRETLHVSGLPVELVRVVSRDEYEAALGAGGFQMILADYRVPSFHGLEALESARATCPDVPFLFVSGAIGEQRAIEALHLGATDYVLKDCLDRLVPAVRRAQDESEERARRRQAEADLKELNRTLEQRIAERTKRLQEYQAQLKSLAHALAVAERQERRRISTALHDDLAQTLVVCKMRLRTLELTELSTACSTAVAEIRGFLDEAIAFTRSLMQELGPSPEFGLDLVAATRGLAQRAGDRFGLKVSVAVDGQAPVLDDLTLTTLLEAVRELLANVARHAGPCEAWVRIGSDGKVVRVMVEDDGRGFTPGDGSRPFAEGGFGLFNVRERIEALGGCVEIDSVPGRGTRVTLVAPQGSAG